MSDTTGTGTWRDHMPLSVLAPLCPEGYEIAETTDRRMLWHLEGSLAVLATTDYLRDLGRAIAAYLHETCEHHWHDIGTWGLPDESMPPRRQCMWCNTVEDMPS